MKNNGNVPWPTPITYNGNPTSMRLNVTTATSFVALTAPTLVIRGTKLNTSKKEKPTASVIRSVLLLPK
jgi:hypothetical protein